MKKLNYCIDCKKLLSDPRSKRCGSCGAKFKWKLIKINFSEQFLIKEYIKNNKTTIQIAKEANCSHATVLKCMKNKGIDRRPRSVSNTKWDKILTKEFLIKEYTIKNKTLKQIAKENKCSKSTIRDYTIIHGIEIRTTGEACSGKNNHMFGKKGVSSPNYKRVKIKCDYCNKIINKPPSYIKKHNFCNRKCQGLYSSLHYVGKNHPSYINGSSYEKYPVIFNNKLKESIRTRDNHQYQNCNMTQEEHFIVYGRDIEVHHIDYDRKNCKEYNLIVLCKQCNIRANYNRDYWIDYYKNKLKIYDKI